MARPGVARSFRIAFVVTVCVWLAVAFFFGNEEAGNRFEEAVRSYFPQVEEWGLLEGTNSTDDAGEEAQ